MTPLAVCPKVSRLRHKAPTLFSYWHVYLFLSHFSHKEVHNGRGGGKARAGTTKESFHCKKLHKHINEWLQILQCFIAYVYLPSHHSFL